MPRSGEFIRRCTARCSARASASRVRFLSSASVLHIGGGGLSSAPKSDWSLHAPSPAPWLGWFYFVPCAPVARPGGLGGAASSCTSGARLSCSCSVLVSLLDRFQRRTVNGPRLGAEQDQSAASYVLCNTPRPMVGGRSLRVHHWSVRDRDPRDRDPFRTDTHHHSHACRFSSLHVPVR